MRWAGHVSYFGGHGAAAILYNQFHGESDGRPVLHIHDRRARSTRANGDGPQHVTRGPSAVDCPARARAGGAKAFSDAHRAGDSRFTRQAAGVVLTVAALSWRERAAGPAGTTTQHHPSLLTSPPRAYHGPCSHRAAASWRSVGSRRCSFVGVHPHIGETLQRTRRAGCVVAGQLFLDIRMFNPRTASGSARGNTGRTTTGSGGTGPRYSAAITSEYTGCCGVRSRPTTPSSRRRWS